MQQLVHDARFHFVQSEPGHVLRSPPPNCGRRHRFPDTHHCEAPVLNSTAKNEAARAVLAKNFPSHHMEKKPVVKRPSELNAKSRPKSKGSELVQLMRMRQTAIPGDPSTGHVDIQNRFHLGVKIDKSNEYRAFWFRKVSCLYSGLPVLIYFSRYRRAKLSTYFNDALRYPAARYAQRPFVFLY